MYEIRVYNSEF